MTQTSIRHQFFCAPVFLESWSGDASNIKALEALNEVPQKLHMLEAVVLRNNDGDMSHTGRFLVLVGDGVDRMPGVREHPIYDPFVHKLQDVTEVRLSWMQHHFQGFAFEVLDRLAGKPTIKFRSYYAMPPLIEL